MSIENLVKIMGATLLNKPSITKIEDIEDDLKKVRTKTLYIAKNQADANKAVELGAYAVLCDFKALITDDEIAWIYVNDLELSIKKLIRFSLIEHKRDVINCSKVEFEILASTVDDNRAVFLGNDIFKNYKLIKNLDNSSILISKDYDLLKDIYPNFKMVDDLETNSDPVELKVIKNTLFLTTLIYQKCYYESLHISDIFIEDLKKALKIIRYFDLSYKLHNIHPKLHFNPIFISDHLKIKNFGETQRVVVTEEDSQLYTKELEYLKNNIKWAKIKAIEPNDNNLIDTLLSIEIKRFNIILIKANYNEVIKYLKEHSQKKAPLLFTE